MPLVEDVLISGHPLGEERMEPWQGCASPSWPQLPGCKNGTTIFNKTENKAQNPHHYMCVHVHKIFHALKVRILELLIIADYTLFIEAQRHSKSAKVNMM